LCWTHWLTSRAACPVGQSRQHPSHTTIPGIPVRNTEPKALETTYSWAFGDGQTSAEFEPAHDYAAAGSYTVTLEACNSAGTCDTFEGIVEVLPLPQAGFSYDMSGLDVAFSNASLHALAYERAFGDGAGATDENPVHTYAAADTYTVVLTATNDCAVDVYSAEVEVTGLYHNYLPLVLKKAP